MRTDEIREREERERQAFSRVTTEGRSAVDDERQLTLSDSTVERYRATMTGAREPATPLEQMFAWMGPSLEGKRVLEICCHTGEYGAILAKLGASVDQVDIAEPAIALARRRAELNGLTDRLRPQVMSVHELEFPDANFDVVFGKAALHHLDLAAARDEISRVLRPGGMGVFSEPVSFSPTLRHLRKLVPVPPDVDSPDERALSGEDLADFCAPFESRAQVFSRVLGRLDRLAPWPWAREWLRNVDRRLLATMPAMRWAAGCCTFLVMHTHG